jgi:hypothetical protein
MLAPIVFHIALKTSVEPVKCTPARSRWLRRVSETVTALPGTKLTTPGGSPAASRIFRMYHALGMALDAGFHTTVLPMSAGAVGRLPPMEVKLKGVIAYTKPSRGRYSSWFHAPLVESGCSE